MEGIFYNSVDDYVDNLEPIRHYREQISLVIQRKLNITEEQADKAAINIIKDRFKDRQVTFFLRKENGDRQLVRCGLARYLNTHVKAQNVIAPSLTTFLPAKVKRSYWSEYTIGNVNKRSIDKKEAQQAAADGNEELAQFKNTSQSNQKTKNNSLSGLYISKASVVVNPSTHSVLTSMTRTMTSLTNANNERLIAGNRALYTPRYALRSVINEARYCNKEAIAEAIKKYNLYIPSTEDIINILKYSADLYIRDGHYYRKHVVPLVDCLTDVEKCGIAYSQDFYHLWTYNPELMRSLFKEMLYKCTEYTEPMENPNIISKIEQSIVYFVHGMFSEEIKGLGKDYEKMNEKGVANNIYHTCLHVKSFLEKHKVFFNAFFLNDISPINSHRLQYMRRRSVALSDTDSSGFSTDNAVEWYLGRFVVNEESIGLTSAITYISSENIVHQLSRLSKYMNVDKSELRRISMKNEWYWTVFTPTEATKHYFADAAIQEGNVFAETEMEIKGVHLKTSNVPDEVLEEGYKLMSDFTDGIKYDRELSLEELIKKAIAVENTIIDSLKNGETKFLSSVNINGPDSYNTTPEKSPYRHHMLWKEVFEDSYYHIPEPPYVTVRVPLTLNNSKDIEEWLETIEDEKFKERITSWFERNKRKDFKNMNINADFVTSNGFPKEIRNIIDINKVTLAMTKQIRIILATFGIILYPDDLIQDHFNFN